jgi:hypothetical protein
LLKGGDGDRMPIGSAKRPGRRYHGESPEYASEECFYRHILDSHLLRLPVQKSSVKGYVGRRSDYLLPLPSQTRFLSRRIHNGNHPT